MQIHLLRWLLVFTDAGACRARCPPGTELAGRSFGGARECGDGPCQRGGGYVAAHGAGAVWRASGPVPSRAAGWACALIAPIRPMVCCGRTNLGIYVSNSFIDQTRACSPPPTSLAPAPPAPASVTQIIIFQQANLHFLLKNPEDLKEKLTPPNVCASCKIHHFYAKFLVFIKQFLDFKYKIPRFTHPKTRVIIAVHPTTTWSPQIYHLFIESSFSIEVSSFL